MNVINRVLMEVFDEKKNTGNVEWNDDIRSRMFRKDHEQQKVSFREGA